MPPFWCAPFRFVAGKLDAAQQWSASPWKGMSRKASFSRAPEGAAAAAGGAEEWAMVASPAGIVEAVVIVDPFSTGAALAKTVAASGRRVVRVFADFNSPVCYGVFCRGLLSPAEKMPLCVSNRSSDAVVHLRNVCASCAKKRWRRW